MMGNFLPALMQGQTLPSAALLLSPGHCAPHSRPRRETERPGREAFTVQVWKLSARVLLTSQWPDADAWLPLAARKAGKGYLTECPRRRGHGLEEEPARLREPRTSSKERWPGQEVIHLQHIVPNEELALAGLQEREQVPL